MMTRIPTYSTAFWVLAFAWTGLAQTVPPRITDMRVISLHDGVNSVPQMTPDGRDGVIVRAGHNSSPIADGSSINYLVLARGHVGHDNWVAVDAETTPSLISDVPFGGMLLGAAPHTGEDWKRSITFAHGKVDGAPALLMILAERDMTGTVNNYAPVPAEISIFRLEADPEFEDDFHFVRVTTQRTTCCYVDVQLAVRDAEDLPLPPEYAGPKTSEPRQPNER